MNMKTEIIFPFNYSLKYTSMYITFIRISDIDFLLKKKFLNTSLSLSLKLFLNNMIKYAYTITSN